MKDKIIKKREKEIKIINLMMRIYCYGNKHIYHNNKLFNKSEMVLCDDCTSLLKYAIDRINKCNFMETKTFCSNCKVHCYQKQEREKIKKVMRYAGPKIILYHPILIIKHLLKSKEKNIS